MNKIFFFSISVRTVPKMERYCSCVSNFITFRISHKRGFLVSSVPNAKYLASDTLDENTLMPSNWREDPMIFIK